MRCGVRCVGFAWGDLFRIYRASALVAAATTIVPLITMLYFGWRSPSFVLTHALEDPYNFDHPNSAHFAQETRVVAQAMGHKPGAQYKYSAPPVFLFEPHQPEMCNFKPQVILNIDEVWDIKRKTFEILAAQKHLWAYYERVALQRGMQGGRNSGKAMTYGEAYQRLFPMALEELV